MLEIKEYIDIKPFSSLKIGGQFRYFSMISKIEDLKEAILFVTEKNIKIFILGRGSNIVFSDGVINVLALKIEIKGFEIASQSENHTDIKVGAGEIWDEVVSRTVDMGLSGFESLSAIPGTVGATPVQNVGAYGSEVKDTIQQVEVFDTIDNQIKILSNENCKFGYRDSIFKNEAKGKYIIIAVTYRLSKLPPNIPEYPDTIKYFNEKNIEKPTLKEIREALIFIRNNKLPNPKKTPNVGSFFKNPILGINDANKIKNDFPDIKLFSEDETHVKVPAGWLIEHVGLKGKSFGNISVYNKNAMILVNNGTANFKDLIEARDEIIKTVQDKFGITLEQEPEIL